MSSKNNIVVHSRSLEGRDLFIVDGLFELDFVGVLHETIKRRPFWQAGSDTEETQDVRHWRHDFAAADFTAHPLLKFWREKVEAKAAELIPAEKGDFDQAYCNSHGYGEYQHIHNDRPSGVTTICYANAEWQPEWQGETMFFDSSQDAHFAVAPRPGRLLIFPSCLLHRGGAPSRICTVRRVVMVLRFRGLESAP